MKKKKKMKDTDKIYEEKFEDSDTFIFKKCPSAELKAFVHVRKFTSHTIDVSEEWSWPPKGSYKDA
eukprot:3017509-Ditylum_brightwellii.AAC.1